MLVLVAAAPVQPNPSLGKAAAACRPGEAGPAIMIFADGLKDRSGLLRAELYPDNDSDFLADDAVLVNAGKTFRRVEFTLSATSGATLCMRVPAAGRYTLSVLHDRNSNRKFDKFSDGVGFASDPRLGWSKPKAATATLNAGPGLTKVAVRMNYLRGFSFRPLDRK
jgi:uncharacterized protein (DUF2141 family)